MKTIKGEVIEEMDSLINKNSNIVDPSDFSFWAVDGEYFYPTYRGRVAKEYLESIGYDLRTVGGGITTGLLKDYHGNKSLFISNNCNF